MPSPSCRDSEKRPSDVGRRRRRGGQSRAGRRARGRAPSRQRRGGGCLVGSRRHGRSGPDLFVGRHTHTLGRRVGHGCRNWRRPRNRRHRRRDAARDRGRGSEHRRRRRRRVDGGDHRRRPGAPVDVDDDAIRVVESEDGVAAGAFQVEHDARRAAGPRSESHALDHRVVKRHRRRHNRRRFGVQQDRGTPARALRCARSDTRFPDRARSRCARRRGARSGGSPESARRRAYAALAAACRLGACGCAARRARSRREAQAAAARPERARTRRRWSTPALAPTARRGSQTLERRVGALDQRAGRIVLGEATQQAHGGGAVGLDAVPREAVGGQKRCLPQGVVRVAVARKPRDQPLVADHDPLHVAPDDALGFAGLERTPGRLLPRLQRRVHPARGGLRGHVGGRHGAERGEDEGGDDSHDVLG